MERSLTRNNRARLIVSVAVEGYKFYILADDLVRYAQHIQKEVQKAFCKAQEIVGGVGGFLWGVARRRQNFGEGLYGLACPKYLSSWLLRARSCGYICCQKAKQAPEVTT